MGGGWLVWVDGGGATPWIALVLAAGVCIAAKIRTPPSDRLRSVPSSCPAFFTGRRKLPFWPQHSLSSAHILPGTPFAADITSSSILAIVHVVRAHSAATWPAQRA